MNKWEYFTAPILNHAAKQILDNFGQDGWERIADYALGWALRAAALPREATIASETPRR